MNIRTSLIAVSILSLLVGQVALAQTTDSFEVTQKMRNLTKQQTEWLQTVQAVSPGDKIEFQIMIIWRGSQSTQNVLVREMLSGKLVYLNNLWVDGNSTVGDIASTNMNIGAMEANQAKQITFEAQLVAAELFALGASDVSNTVTVFNADGGASTVSLIQVNRTGTPTDVPTGPLSMGVVAIALALLAAGALGAFLFIRSYIRREVLESAYNTRTERKFATMIGAIKKQEKRG